MTAITLKNVRCFVEPQPVPIAPLTLLVGENSTGKSTFLAMTRVLAEALGHFPKVNFNEAPFRLGAFRDIANHRPDGGQADSFSVGLTRSIPTGMVGDVRGGVPDDLSFVAEFILGEAEPTLSQWRVQGGGFGVTLWFGEADTLRKVEVETPSGPTIIAGNDVNQFPWSTSRNPFFLVEFLQACVRQPLDFVRSKIAGRWTEDEIAPLVALEERLGEVFPRVPNALAPVRTRPQRTYDPLTTQIQPEGQHVPMLLRRLLTEESTSNQRFRQTLCEFGRASALFSSLRVKNLGVESNSPFQILVEFGETGGQNLIDVGYGVSQALPIIVEIIRSSERSTLLIQQPEVHLHPRAQAALGSLLVRVAKAQKKRFLVETHSDYLVDRVRMEIRENEHLTPADAQILYFQREDDGRVEIYPLELDEQGNIVNAPPGYREFFLREEERFLGV